MRFGFAEDPVRSPREDIREAIRGQRSPMAAKMIAKKHKDLMLVEQMSEEDVQNMYFCLTLKIQQHKGLRPKLLATGDLPIIEDCSKRPHGSGPFWGAVWDGKEWKGENRLGKLWMKLRDVLRDYERRMAILDSRNS